MFGETEGRRTLARMRVAAVGVLLAAAFVTITGSASAQPATTCVKATKVTPARPAKKHFTGSYNDKECTEANATHEGKFDKLSDLVLTNEQEKTLTALLEHVKVVEKGDPVPYVVFSGANVQIESGAGSECALGSETGNLIVGYDENPGNYPQTGSNNLVVGGPGQTFTSCGGIVAGAHNSVTAPYATVTGGEGNTASNMHAAVSGGHENTASGEEAWVGGGVHNIASSYYASVSGGESNEAAWIDASVSGGQKNVASGQSSWLGGGFANEATGPYSSILGGHGATASNYDETLP